MKNVEELRARVSAFYQSVCPECHCEVVKIIEVREPICRLEKYADVKISIFHKVCTKCGEEYSDTETGIASTVSITAAWWTLTPEQTQEVDKCLRDTGVVHQYF